MQITQSFMLFKLNICKKCMIKYYNVLTVYMHQAIYIIFKKKQVSLKKLGICL